MIGIPGSPHHDDAVGAFGLLDPVRRPQHAHAALAHVGVLKVLEELRVPIHCVTGTSMGAIVGGTFAAGRPPAEMEKIVLAADWETIFRDRPPRRRRRRMSHAKSLRPVATGGPRSRCRKDSGCSACSNRGCRKGSVIS